MSIFFALQNDDYIFFTGIIIQNCFVPKSGAPSLLNTSSTWHLYLSCQGKGWDDGYGKALMALVSCHLLWLESSINSNQLV